MSRFGQVQKLFYDTLMQSQYWPRARLQDLQRRHLARLLRHARDEVPFYKDRLDGIFLSSGQIDWERWTSVPIVTRADLLAHRDAMQSVQLDAAHGATERDLSSGSSGTPISVTHTDYARASQGGAIFRAHRWHGLDWSKNLLVMSVTTPGRAMLPDGDAGTPWGAPWAPESVGRTYHLNLRSPAAEVLDYIVRNDIFYLGCRPKTAQGLALEAIATGRTIRLGAVITFGTAIQADEMDDCRRAFGAEMFGPYSSTEALLMAYRCPVSGHDHVNEEQCLVELVDDAGRAVRDGEVGRVVVTPLFNFAQPLIRYDQGDLAVFGPPCSCGRSLRVIERIVGRVTHLFRLPDGRRIAPQVPRAIRDELHALYWQVAQVAPLGFEVRYVPFEDTIPNLEAAAAMVRAAIHPDATIDFRRQPDLVRVDGGKYMEYVCEIA